MRRIAAFVFCEIPYAYVRWMVDIIHSISNGILEVCVCAHSLSNFSFYDTPLFFGSNLCIKAGALFSFSHMAILK